MPNDFETVNLDVLLELGPGRPRSFHLQYDGTPESWANVLHQRREYHARCRAADDAYARRYPGLNFQRLCDRPGIAALLENPPAPDFTPRWRPNDQPDQ